MSLYVVCPSCGRLLGDKEILFQDFIQDLNNKENLTDEDKQKKLDDFIHNTLKIPRQNICCKIRLLTFVDAYPIIKSDIDQH